MKDKRIAIWTDIHLGKKNNSVQHNEDCLDFMKWFCDNVRRDGKITHAVFMGDWFENRNSVNVMTLDYSFKCLELVNSLNIPIYIIVGNHDLYHRENRNVFSTNVFREFSNVTIVSEPLVVDQLLLCPFIFKDEYPGLAQYNHLDYWLGHFEFRNFIITGNDRRMEHGPDASLFTGPKAILSGHFHKRQANGNVVYVGSCFPADYGDAGDDARGMTILDTESGEIDLIDWEDCPKYRKIRLSQLLNNLDMEFPPKCRVRCTIDVDISYSEAQQLKDEFAKTLGLREFSLEENILERKEAIAGSDDQDDIDLSSLNTAVKQLIYTGVSGTATINPEKLIDIYDSL